MATRKEIREFVAKVLSGHRFTAKEKDWIDLPRVTESEAIEISDKTGKNVSGHSRVITRDYILHALDEHGDPEIERRRGQIAITPKDFELIPEIVSKGHVLPGVTKNRQGLECITYALMTDSSGTVLYVEAIRTGRKKLSLQTMYKHRLKKKKAR